jgi:hypothetical protein
MPERSQESLPCGQRHARPRSESLMMMILWCALHPFQHSYHEEGCTSSISMKCSGASITIQWALTGRHPTDLAAGCLGANDCTCHYVILSSSDIDLKESQDAACSSLISSDGTATLCSALSAVSTVSSKCNGHIHDGDLRMRLLHIATSQVRTLYMI